MGIEIGAQLDALWRSLFLGAAFALLYDGLRALRLRRRTRRALTDLLDALYCLFLAAALLAFTLRIGQGELRLYMLAFIALGAYLSFALLSPLLRPLWDFWADCLFAFARLLRAPLLLVKKYYGKLHKFAKKLFLFSRRTLIIENYKRSARRSRRAAERRGGVQYGRGKQGGGALPKLLLLALLLLIGAHLLNLRQEISRAEAEKQTLSAQLEQQQRENDSLSSALEKADDPEYLQELAREQLDMVSPGEKVFYDVSS